MAQDTPRHDARLGGPVVDVHHHWMPRELVERMEEYVPQGYRIQRLDTGVCRVYQPDGVQVMTVNPQYYCDARVQIRDMNAAGIDLALLSSSCFPSWMTLKAARLMNDASAELQRQYPDRFLPMAHVPPFGEAGAIEELDRAGRQLGLRGVCITTNFHGHYPDEDEYRAFLRKAVELDLPVYVHAAGAPPESRGMAQWDLARTMGRSLEHALVTIRLLYSGVLDELPGLRMVMPHLGGAFFINMKRFFHSPPHLINNAPEVPYRRLMGQLLFDTAPSFWYGPTEIACAVTTLGVERVALGSDYPAFWEPSVMADAVAHVKALPISDADKARVAGGNALAFYKLPAGAGAR